MKTPHPALEALEFIRKLAVDDVPETDFDKRTNALATRFAEWKLGAAAFIKSSPPQSSCAGGEVDEELMKLVSDEEIEAVWGNANFGSQSKRGVIADTVLKIGGGFSTGYTAICIGQELGLLGKPKYAGDVALTKKGKRYLYYSVKRPHLTPPQWNDIATEDKK